MKAGIGPEKVIGKLQEPCNSNWEMGGFQNHQFDNHRANDRLWWDFKGRNVKPAQPGRSPAESVLLLIVRPKGRSDDVKTRKQDQTKTRQTRHRSLVQRYQAGRETVYELSERFRSASADRVRHPEKGRGEVRRSPLRESEIDEAGWSSIRNGLSVSQGRRKARV